MYVIDNNDRIEPPNCGGQSGSVNHSQPAGWLYKPGQALPGGANGTNYYGPSRGLFYPAMLSWGMYMCPIHRTNTLAWRLSNIRFTSYLMNGAVINGYGSFDWSSGEQGRTFKSFAFRPTDMLFWETDENDPGYFNDGASRPSEGFSKRHVSGAIVGLFGGHVEFIKWNKYYQILADPMKNSLWCYPNSADGRVAAAVTGVTGAFHGSGGAAYRAEWLSQEAGCAPLRVRAGEGLSCGCPRSCFCSGPTGESRSRPSSSLRLKRRCQSCARRRPRE